METIQDYVHGGLPPAPVTANATGEGKSRQIYYYVWGMKDGKLYVDGGFNDERQAWEVGYNKMRLPEPNVEALNTKQLKVATAHIKHMRLMSTNDLLGSTQRARHKV
jgi:hypothetical protein